ncbi:SGNH/GDSL hydrolase family protein [Gloeocapsa sp. PCC 73106]|uniref:SGNH/GDSL hydrolase family protein n=1 Tax=Gloeocapsa sp. PCC 73106 TaxID=102232 RepID=UPI0002ABCF4A|nr:SGNH/GDSL hydrolase family protein [Gloeocapsa sp. PCC 73106]ELR98076.1 lysophospholipase L1-like esterase [Gloeocapsa sp. PCC 73106]
MNYCMENYTSFVTSTVRIMPLGDSVTSGQHGPRTSTPGSYRIQLWDNFVSDRLRVDFVGSLSNGPQELGDKDHEGNGAYAIHGLNNLIIEESILSIHQPDIILLITGANDVIRNYSLNRMYTDLSNLIDTITTQLPNVELLVSSLTPLNPLIKGDRAANKARDFNNLIPDLVEDKAAEGKNVIYVNAGGSLSVEDLATDGIHPSASGYDELGDVWYQALLENSADILLNGVRVRADVSQETETLSFVEPETSVFASSKTYLPFENNQGIVGFENGSFDSESALPYLW